MTSSLSRRGFLGMISGAACAMGASPLALGAKSARKPNIVVFIADDLGYGDVSCYGATRVQTPNIDRLAKEGLRFTNGYASAATCTPTRYALMTGEYAWRKPGTGVAAPEKDAIIKPGRVTLPSVLRDAGYATGAIGKWHLGLGEGKPDWNGEINPGPLEIGFDTCFIIPTTGDRVPSVFVKDHHIVGLDPNDPISVSRKPIPNEPNGKDNPELLKVKWSKGHYNAIVNGISRIGYMSGGKSARWVDEDIADTLTGEARKFIAAHRKEPFFLYYGSHDIHVPRVPHDRFKGTSQCGTRGDAIHQLDFQVGEVLKELDRHNLTDDTIFVFCSDNGPVLDDGYADGAVKDLNGHTPSGPLQGGKYSLYEGGTRTPLLLRWPKEVSKGQTSSALVSLVDFTASFAALTGQTLPHDAAPDSFDVMPALLGKKGARGRDRLITQARGLALIQGDWKYLDIRKKKKKGKDDAEQTPPPGELYNLRDDIGETTNLAAKYPERVEQMRAYLAKARADKRTRP